MIALFLTDPCTGTGGPSDLMPIAVFDHWEDRPDGSCGAVTAEGHYVVQLGGRGQFHFDADNPHGWQRMVRSGQGVVTQHDDKRFAYYWLNWQ